MKKEVLCLLLISAAGLFVAGGCTSPIPREVHMIPIDSDPFRGGITTGDIRTVATQMAPAILALPEITDAADRPVRIKIADIKNSSRFFIDRNLFIKRLTVELNKYGRDKIRFLNNNEKADRARNTVLKDRRSATIEKNLKLIAAQIADSPGLPKNKKIKVAVLPVLNTNLVNMNADSFAAMLRSEIFNASAGRIQFLMPGVTTGADYYLTGQFIPESLKTEGIINLADYIEVVEARVKSGKSMYIMTELPGNTAPVITTTQQGSTEITAITPGTRKTTMFEAHLKQILSNPALRTNADVNKRLNVVLVDAKEKLSIYEGMVLLDGKISDRSGIAKYVISGEISGMHQRKNGKASDYVMISIQLVDIENNETVWEDAYEVKRMVENGVVYR